MDWLRDNLWAAWLSIAGVLALAELASLDFTPAMLAAIRPLLVRKLHHSGELKTGSAHVIGRTGTVVKEIHPDGGGSVRLGGDLWTARPYDEVSTIKPGTRVEVMSIDGATAVVYPLPEPARHELDTHPDLNDPEPGSRPAQ